MCSREIVVIEEESTIKEVTVTVRDENSSWVHRINLRIIRHRELIEAWLAEHS